MSIKQRSFWHQYDNIRHTDLPCLVPLPPRNVSRADVQPAHDLRGVLREEFPPHSDGFPLPEYRLRGFQTRLSRCSGRMPPCNPGTIFLKKMGWIFLSEYFLSEINPLKCFQMKFFLISTLRDVSLMELEVPICVGVNYEIINGEKPLTEKGIFERGKKSKARPMEEKKTKCRHAADVKYMLVHGLQSQCGQTNQNGLDKIHGIDGRTRIPAQIFLEPSTWENVDLLCSTLKQNSLCLVL